MPNQPHKPDEIKTGDRRVDYQSGDVIDGRYRIEHVLGSGGMGVVYQVTQIFVDKHFALKTLIKEQISEVKIRRFQQEARAVFALDHPNIIAVKDFGIIEEEMTPFLVMELIDGETLGERLKRSGRLTLEESIPIFVQTCFGLGYAHDQGIVHRDIKPSNIMLLNGIEIGAEGSVKIVDFGIAKFAQNEGGEIQALTKTGEIFGSPFYMSPEQCAGERVDYRADVYSLGCVLFEALTGTPPCVGESALSTMMQHQISQPPTLKEASMGLDFPPELEKIVAKMLAKEPEKRYQKLGIVAHHLGALQSNSGFKQAPIVISESKKIENVKRSDSAAPKESKPISISREKLFALCGGVALVASISSGMFGYFLGQTQTKKSDASQQSNIDTKKTSGSAVTSDAVTETNPNTKAKSIRPDPDSELSDTEKVPPNTIINLPPPKVIPAVPATLIPSTPRFASGFSFPKNISVGILKVDNQHPFSVCGEKSVSRKSKLTFYTRHSSRDVPELLDKFRPDDLNGVEVVFKSPEAVLKRVKNWTHLEELCFFNSLIKALPRAEDHDETPVTDELLPSVDKLTTLKTLGLCSPEVTGYSVAKMSLLRSLHTIKLKGIRHVEPLLVALADHPNIEEVWLISEMTDNHQLELLTRMPNLTSLTIRRSQLTPSSLAIFSRMKKLKHLTLDRNTWSEEDKKMFKKKLADCRFEPVIDIQYWYLLPDQPMNSVEIAKRYLDRANAAQREADRHSGDNHPHYSSEAQKMFEGPEGKFSFANVVTQPEVLETYGPTPQEVALIVEYPFDVIRPQEREFDKRLRADLEKATNGRIAEYTKTFFGKVSKIPCLRIGTEAQFS